MASASHGVPSIRAHITQEEAGSTKEEPEGGVMEAGSGRAGCLDGESGCTLGSSVARTAGRAGEVTFTLSLRVGGLKWAPLYHRGN